MKRPEILFHLRAKKASKKEFSNIYLRITVEKKRAELSINRKIKTERWDTYRQRMKGNREDAKELNHYLELMRSRVYAIHKKLIEDHEMISAAVIKDIMLGKAKKEKTLNEIILTHNQQVKERVGLDMSLGTYKKFETIHRIVKEFLQMVYGKEDLYLHQLNHEFVTLFDHHLRTHRKCNNNSTVKYIRLFKKITTIALNNDWMEKDPFRNFKMKLNEVKREFLTEAELESIVKKEMNIERLDLVRDIFVFSCYTGLAYVDVKNLSPNNIVLNMEGDRCISFERTKTKAETYVPLFHTPLEILKKYKDHPKAINTGKLLPILSNQKMNSYLKEIADICGIKKRISFHLARHTFATTVLLNNDVPYESVKIMLGHKDIKTTQHYAKVLNRKVNNDVRLLKEKLNPNKENPNMTIAK